MLGADVAIGSLLGQLAKARQRTDAMFASVPELLLYERPIPERHRIAFYLGHLEAFDGNLLTEPNSPHRNGLDHLFAFGIDPLGETLPTDERDDWPQSDAIRDYARSVRTQLDHWLPDAQRRHVGSVPVPTLLHAAIEHRLMHAETLAYILHRLAGERPLQERREPWRELGNEDMVSIPAGEATLGVDGEQHFGWDNELTLHRVDVPAFRIDRHMVSNAQFLRFLNADGYGTRRWWGEADWDWRERHGLSAPPLWERVGTQWYLATRTERLPLPADWPVFVSHAEASAYARWCHKTLPTEAQWHRAAYGTPDGLEPPYPWGEAPLDATRGNFDFQRWDPTPVDAHPAGASAFGVLGLLGNGWEWTLSEFAPFPGFEPFSFYRGYSADFFDGKHYVLKGGSAHTAQPFLRRSFRNWFQAHYPYPFAGFRCVTPP